MILKKLELVNLRNYEYINLEFNDRINIFYGNNAQGKTNILEAVYVCALGKSFRSRKDAELVKFGEDFGIVDISFCDKNLGSDIIPVFNRSKVFDVTGAGDTVTAIYTMGLATGAEPLYAAVMGNIAASIVIKQFGCATTTTNEMIKTLEKIEI